MLGFKYNEHSLIVHPRIQLNVISCTMYDWAHCLICDGICDGETGLFFKELSRHQSYVSSIYEFGWYALKFTTPKSLPSLTAILHPKRLDANLVNEHWSCSASEFLTLYPILRTYVINLVCKRNELPDHCRSLLYCLEILEKCHLLKARDVSPTSLQASIERWRDAFDIAYGRAHARPKIHYVLHLPLMLLFHGCLLSTLVNERRHRVVKRYTRDRCAVKDKWEVGALEEIITFQAHEAHHVDFFKSGMLDPHPIREHTWRALADFMPGVARDDVQVSNRLRTDYGTLTAHDYVFYMASDGVRLGFLEFIASIGQSVVCIIATFDHTARTNEWMECRANEGMIMVPGRDLICSTLCLVDTNIVEVYLPCFVRSL